MLVILSGLQWSSELLVGIRHHSIIWRRQYLEGVSIKIWFKHIFVGMGREALIGFLHFPHLSDVLGIKSQGSLLLARRLERDIVSTDWWGLVTFCEWHLRNWEHCFISIFGHLIVVANFRLMPQEDLRLGITINFLFRIRRVLLSLIIILSIEAIIRDIEGQSAGVFAGSVLNELVLAVVANWAQLAGVWSIIRFFNWEYLTYRWCDVARGPCSCRSSWSVCGNVSRRRASRRCGCACALAGCPSRRRFYHSPAPCTRRGCGLSARTWRGGPGGRRARTTSGSPGSRRCSGSRSSGYPRGASDAAWAWRFCRS